MIITDEIIKIHKAVISDKSLNADERYLKLMELDETNRKEIYKEFVKYKTQQEKYDSMNDREQRVYNMNQFLRDCKEAGIDCDIPTAKKIYKL
jgi:hypothetical protein